VSPAERSRQEVKRVYWNLRLLGLPEPLRDLWMLIVTGLVVWALAVQGQQADHAAQESSRTTGALCALRHDLEDRVAQTDTFLHSHPNGFAGIPAATLRNGEQGQLRTIQALSNLTCPAPK
jgi:hypothetical protein